MARSRCFALSLAALLWTPGTAQDPVLTEMMARNANTLFDRDGEYRDWFEVHNPTNAPLPIGGYYATDDPNLPRKWQFPAQSIPSGGYLVVFASYKDRAVANQELHTNFTLDGDGGYLALVRPDGVTVVSTAGASYPEQRTGFSYARTTAGWLFADTPTPGRANGSGVPGFTGPVAFDAPRGYHQGAVTVGITCATPGATIRYTTDGSVPTATYGFIYTGPLTVRTSAVLRAAGFALGLGPSEVAARTFLFVDQVVQQPDLPFGFPSQWNTAPASDYGMDPEITQSATYKDRVKTGLLSIPTVSLSLPVADMFGSAGIYTNPLQSGWRWEREVSAEYFDPATGQGFETRAGIRIQGGASRLPEKSPKHSFSLRFRDAYRGDLKFPVYPTGRVTRFDALQLRACFGNSFIHWQHIERARCQLIRDQWMRDSLIDMGQDDAGRGRYVCLFINGLFWGVYNLHERAEASHFAAWNGGDSKEVDARNGAQVVDGTAAAWNAMRSAVTSRNWAEIQKRLDVDNYIDWLIINRFGGNIDLKSTENWRAAGGGPNLVPFRFYSWDAERVLEDPNASGTRPSSDPPALLSYLDDIPEFVVRFGDRLQRHLFHDGALSPARTAARLLRRSAELDTAIVAESARWGDYRRDKHSWQIGPYELYTRDQHWITEQRRLVNGYFPGRTATVLLQFQQLGLFPSFHAPLYTQQGGVVQAGYPLRMVSPDEIWYTTDGTDPRLPGGAVSPTATRFSAVVRIDVSTTVKARARRGAQWSAVNEARFVVEGLRLNEVLAENATGIRDNAGEREDWIELYNVNARPVDPAGMFLTDDPRDPTKWRIPAGAAVPSGGTLLVFADGDLHQGPLHAGFKLARTGEEVLLVDVDGRTVLDRIRFGPQVADVSTGRLTDGGGRWASLLEPTPGQPNGIAVCGTRRYSALDPTRQALDLFLTGIPGLNRNVVASVRGGSAGVRALIAGAAPDELTLGTGDARLLVAVPFLVVTTQSAPASGAVDFALQVPGIPALVGQQLFLQAWSLGTPWHATGGLEIKICQ